MNNENLSRNPPSNQKLGFYQTCLLMVTLISIFLVYKKTNEQKRHEISMNELFDAGESVSNPLLQNIYFENIHSMVNHNIQAKKIRPQVEQQNQEESHPSLLNSQITINPQARDIKINVDYSNMIENDNQQSLAYLQTKLLPEAFNFILDKFKIRELENTYQFPDDQCIKSQIPKLHQEEGVNSDLIFYVSDIDKNNNFKQIVWGITCYRDESHGNRPVAVQLNFNYLNSSSQFHDSNLRYLLLQIIQVLALGKENFDFFVNKPIIKKNHFNRTSKAFVTPKKKQLVRMLHSTPTEQRDLIDQNDINFIDQKTSNIQVINSILSQSLDQLAQEFFQCYDIYVGVPLATFDSQIYKDAVFLSQDHFFEDLFVSEPLPSWVLSQFTLALIEDSGWYSIDVQNDTPFVRGQDQGCLYLYDIENFLKAKSLRHDIETFQQAVQGLQPNIEQFISDMEYDSSFPSYLPPISSQIPWASNSQSLHPSSPSSIPSQPLPPPPSPQPSSFPSSQPSKAAGNNKFLEKADLGISKKQINHNANRHQQKITLNEQQTKKSHQQQNEDLGKKLKEFDTNTTEINSDGLNDYFKNLPGFCYINEFNNDFGGCNSFYNHLSVCNSTQTEDNINIIEPFYSTSCLQPVGGIFSGNRINWTGETISYRSRCIISNITNNQIKSQYETNQTEQTKVFFQQMTGVRCYETQCDQFHRSIQIKLIFSNTKSIIKCIQSGQVLSYNDGSASGLLQCPEIDTFCNFSNDDEKCGQSYLCPNGFCNKGVCHQFNQQ